MQVCGTRRAVAARAPKRARVSPRCWSKIRGPGIASSDPSLIFEPFYRGKSIRESKTSGISLGLAIVRKIVENHRGKALFKDVSGRHALKSVAAAPLKSGTVRLTYSV